VTEQHLPRNLHPVDIGTIPPADDCQVHSEVAAPQTEHPTAIRRAMSMPDNRFQDDTPLIRTALQILEQEPPMTLRQLFSRLASDGEIHNDVRSYGGLEKLIAQIREDGSCPAGWIVDHPRLAATIDQP
jgi:hypothetical protein